MRNMARFGLVLLPLLVVCAITVAGCLLCYIFDNKYTAPRPALVFGMAVIDEHLLAEHPVVLLVDGWEVYGGQLLAPEDFDREDRPEPDEVIFLGQYGGFEGFLSSGSPHGSVTYRLVLRVPEASCSYTLELPEIFSAYRAYVDGALVAERGEVDPAGYRPETLNTTVTFEAGGVTEIIFQVSDFSHLYSGMVYPPAFGVPDDVAQLLSARFLFRALLAAVALTIGVLAALVGILSRRVRPALLYGLLCLCFAGYIGYPLVKTFFGAYYPFYALENLAFCAMLLVVGLLLQSASAIKGLRALVFPLFGAAVCALSVAFHVLLATQGAEVDAGQGSNILAYLYGYSLLISVYEWVTAVYLTILAVRIVWKRVPHSKPILFGIVVFDTALVMDRILSLHEPIVTGWFPELASFVLILCVGVAVGAEVAEQYQSNAVLNERAQSMEHLMQVQQSYYTILDEKMEDTLALRHDLRHHVSVLDAFIAGRQYEELAQYLSGFKHNIEEAAPREYSYNRIVNVLANHYSALAKRQGISFELLSDLDSSLALPSADLSALLCNLLENALEACGQVLVNSKESEPDRSSEVNRGPEAEKGSESERFIRVGIAHLGTMLNIRVVNSAVAGLIPSPSGNNRYTSTKTTGRTGYGLYSIRMIVKKYSGQSQTNWDEDTHTFTHAVTLFLR